MARVKFVNLTAKAMSTALQHQHRFSVRTTLEAHGIPVAARARPALLIVDLVKFVKMVYIYIYINVSPMAVRHSLSVVWGNR